MAQSGTEPVVIDEELLLRAVNEQAAGDAADIARKEGIDFREVAALRLDYCNILKIENLWQFESLTKLQLDNNIIEQIENLGHLVNLTWLDLSFNNISRIEGLDGLTRLTDLSLFNNKLTRLENMDKLTRLTCLSVGNNQIQDIAHLSYLMQFTALRVLNVAGNPLCRDHTNYKSYLLARMPHLKYIDYRLVDQQAVSDARSMYIDDVIAIEEEANVAAKQASERRRLELEAQRLAEAFLPGIQDLLRYCDDEDDDAEAEGKVKGNDNNNDDDDDGDEHDGEVEEANDDKGDNGDEDEDDSEERSARQKSKKSKKPSASKTGKIKSTKKKTENETKSRATTSSSRDNDWCVLREVAPDALRDLAAKNAQLRAPHVAEICAWAHAQRAARDAELAGYCGVVDASITAVDAVAQAKLKAHRRKLKHELGMCAGAGAAAAAAAASAAINASLGATASSSSSPTATMQAANNSSNLNALSQSASKPSAATASTSIAAAAAAAAAVAAAAAASAAATAAGAVLARARVDLDRLVDELLGLEMGLVEEFEELYKEFERNYQDMCNGMREHVSGWVVRQREMQGEAHERVTEVVMAAYERLGKSEMDDLSETLRDLLRDKEALVNHLGGTSEYQQQRIDRQEELFVAQLTRHQEQLLERLQRDEHARSRHRIREILLYRDRSMSEIEAVEEGLMASAPAGGGGTGGGGGGGVTVTSSSAASAAAALAPLTAAS